MRSPLPDNQEVWESIGLPGEKPKFVDGVLLMFIEMDWECGCRLPDPLYMPDEAEQRRLTWRRLGFDTQVPPWLKSHTLSLMWTEFLAYEDC